MRLGIVCTFDSDSGEGLVRCLRSGSFFYLHRSILTEGHDSELEGVLVSFEAETENGARSVSRLELHSMASV